MIWGMAPFRRVLSGVVTAAMLAALAPTPAFAQSGQDGWFEEGNGAAQPEPQPQPPPAPPPRAPGPGVPAAPEAPAAPQAPNRPAPAEALPPSPLYDNSAPAYDDGAAPPNAPPQQGAPAQTSADQDPRALTAWGPYVDPYGTWVDDARYGRVWIPSPNVVGADFAPYSTGGHWARDENNDWVWVSDYPFGWVTFHYGRWVWIAGRGWAWIPGMQYAPAWVVWRVPVGSYDYVGWAPYPPSYVWFGVGVGFGAYWAYPWYYPPVYPWVFCPSAYVYSAHVHTYIVHDHAEVAYAARNTRAYNVSPPHPGGTTQGAPVAPHGPSPQAAHVPAHAVPMERVSSHSLAARGNASIAMASARPSAGARASVFTRSRAIPMDQRPAPGRGFPADRAGMTTRPDLRGHDIRPRPDAGMRPAAAPEWNRDRVFAQRPGVAPQSAPRMSPPPRVAPDRTQMAPRPVTTPRIDPGRMRSAPVFHGGGGGFRPSGGGFHPSGGGSFHGGGGHGRR